MLGMTEILIIVFVIIILLFGAKKLPELARSIGRAKGEFERGKMEIDKEIKEEKRKEAEKEEKEAEKKFGFLLEAYKYGAPIHGGMGLGLDRLVALMCKLPDIREVIAFPKNKAAQCPMDDSPGGIEKEQLKTPQVLPALKKINSGKKNALVKNQVEIDI